MRRGEFLLEREREIGWKGREIGDTEIILEKPTESGQEFRWVTGGKLKRSVFPLNVSTLYRKTKSIDWIQSLRLVWLPNSVQEFILATLWPKVERLCGTPPLVIQTLLRRREFEEVRRATDLRDDFGHISVDGKKHPIPPWRPESLVPVGVANHHLNRGNHATNSFSLYPCVVPPFPDRPYQKNPLTWCIF